MVTWVLQFHVVYTKFRREWTACWYSVILQPISNNISMFRVVVIVEKRRRKSHTRSVECGRELFFAAVCWLNCLRWSSVISFKWKSLFFFRQNITWNAACRGKLIWHTRMSKLIGFGERFMGTSWRKKTLCFCSLRCCGLLEGKDF